MHDVADQENADQAHDGGIDPGHGPPPRMIVHPEPPDADDIEEKGQHGDGNADGRAHAVARPKAGVTIGKTT